MSKVVTLGEVHIEHRHEGGTDDKVGNPLESHCDGDCSATDGVGENAPIAMPSEPQMRSGLRPHFSTVKIATRAKRMLMTPMNTVTIIGFSIPMSPKIRGA